MQNSKLEMQTERLVPQQDITCGAHDVFAFCILHFEFR